MSENQVIVRQRREAGKVSLRDIRFNAASPEDTLEQIKACLTDEQRVFVEAYLSRSGPVYLNGSAAARLINPLSTSPSQLAAQFKQAPAVQLLIQYHLAQHGLGRDRALGQLARWLYDTDVADYEPYLDGTVTLTELRDSGVDTAAVAEIVERRDKHGGVTRAVKLIPKLGLMNQLLRALGAFDRAADTPPAAIQQHNTQQLMVVSSTVADELRAGVSRPTAPGVPIVPIEAGKPTRAYLESLEARARHVRQQIEAREAPAEPESDDSPPATPVLIGRSAEDYPDAGMGEQDAGSRTV